MAKEVAVRMLRSASPGVVVLADLITYNQSANLGLSVPVEGPIERRCVARLPDSEISFTSLDKDLDACTS